MPATPGRPGLHRGPLVILVLALLLAWFAAGCATVDGDDLHSDVQAVHSAAAEGVLLADQAARSRVPSLFVWLHSQELRHHVIQVSERLDGQITGGDVQSEVPEAKQLAAAVASELGMLHQEPADPALALQIKQELAQLATASEELADKLE